MKHLLTALHELKVVPDTCAVDEYMSMPPPWIRRCELGKITNRSIKETNEHMIQCLCSSDMVSQEAKSKPINSIGYKLGVRDGADLTPEELTESWNHAWPCVLVHFSLWLCSCMAGCW